MTKKSLIAVAVVSAMHSGYRRAGIALEKGTNDLEVSQEQLKQFQDDPKLAVSIKETSKATKKPSNSNSKTNQKPALPVVDRTIDFSHVPEGIAPYVAAIHLMHCETPLSDKPKVDDLEIEVPGETEDDEPTKVKPSAAVRDEAWQYYLDNFINHVPG